MKRRRAIDLGDIAVTTVPVPAVPSPEPIAQPDPYDQDVLNALPTKVKTEIDFGDEQPDESGLPDPVEMVRQAIAADLDSSVFSSQQFPEADNVIDWCRGHQWLNYETDLFARQIQVLVKFFEDACYFCSDVDYIHDVKVDDSPTDVLSHYTLLQHGICPNCKRNRTEILAEWIKDSRYGQFNRWDACVEPRPVPPNEFVGIWGQRSGKSITTASFIWTYILHRLLVLPSPTRYYRLATNGVLQASFVSPTRGQGKDNLWDPFLHAYDASPWFKQVAQYLKQESKRLGVMLYHRQQTFMVFPGKRIAAHVQTANNVTLRGATRCFGAVDELGHLSFTSNGTKRASVHDGTEIFTSLANSLRTIRSAAESRRVQLGDYSAIDGYMVNVSSPLDIGDPIEQRAAIAPKSFRMYCTRFPTWKVNPKENEDLIREEFAGNPVIFTRDFGAQPQRAANPFIQDEKIVDVTTVEKSPRIFTSVIETVETDGGVSLLRAKLSKITSDKSVPRCITVDNGERNNSFALCVARYYPEQDGMLVEELLEIAPTKEAAVDLAWCYNELVVPLVKQLHCVHVAYDRWESGYAVADLRTNYKIDAQRYSLRWKDFELFRDDLCGMRVFTAQPEVPWKQVLTVPLADRAQWPRAHFQAQLLTVSERAKTLSKPTNGNDDSFRTVVLAHRFISKFREAYRHNQRVEGDRAADRPVALFFGRSNRGHGAGPGRSKGQGRGSGRHAAMGPGAL